MSDLTPAELAAHQKYGVLKRAYAKSMEQIRLGKVSTGEASIAHLEEAERIMQDALQQTETGSYHKSH